MNQPAITVRFNDENLSIEAGSTAQKLIEIAGVENDRFIIVLNGNVLNRSQCPDCILKSGDVVDLITPISGG